MAACWGRGGGGGGEDERVRVPAVLEAAGEVRAASGARLVVRYGRVWVEVGGTREQVAVARALLAALVANTVEWRSPSSRWRNFRQRDKSVPLLAFLKYDTFHSKKKTRLPRYLWLPY